MSQPVDYEWWKIVVQIAGYVGGWIAIVIGWKVSWGQNLKRELRKERRDLIDRLVQLSHEIERSSIDLLSSAPRDGDEARALHIRNDISRLSRAVSRLKTECGFDCTSEVIAFRQTVTGGQLDSAERKALEPDASDLRAIGIASLNLVDKMEAEHSRLSAR